MEEETGVPGENPQNYPGPDSKPGSSCCEITMLTATPLCHPSMILTTTNKTHMNCLSHTDAHTFVKLVWFGNNSISLVVGSGC